ncbi:hypothetical protein Pla123a_17940 [Posidoniimonas polymericola]|uniref:Uncharacterized protein n=2 Tax=Posidoniimonas polymericola TaxID=2528002 RepID=A0A5C5YSR5_9BACT|nr:hypothetical protein Pla123a_17940 [Posidoniimonas polymericola]
MQIKVRGVSMHRAFVALGLVCVIGCDQMGSRGKSPAGGVSEAEHQQLQQRYDKLVEEFNSSALVREIERLRKKLEDAEDRDAESASLSEDGLGYRLAAVVEELAAQGFKPEAISDWDADQRGLRVDLRRSDLPALRVQLAGPPANVSELTVTVDASGAMPKKAFGEAAELCVGYGGYDAEELRRWMAAAVTSGEAADPLKQSERSLVYEQQESRHVFTLSRL